MKKLLPLFALCPLLLAGCATQAVTLSSLDQPGDQVMAEVSQFNILGLSPLTIEQAAEVVNNLNEQCGGTGVTGVTTRTGSIYAIIGIIEKIEATGFCKTE